MNNVLEIANLSYNNILNNLDLKLHDKSFNILVGSNGCGKTTLVNSILGLNNYSGTVSINVSKEEIGVVLSDNLLLSPIVIDNLLYPLINLGKDESESKKIVYDISKKFKIDNLLFKDINDLSNSQKKIVTIISSIIYNPKLIIIDDSFDDLDFSISNMLINYLSEVSKNACVLILTSNSKFLKYATHIYVLTDGKITKSLKYSDIENEEKLFNSINIKLPFLQELNNKLILYKVIDKSCSTFDDLVNEIWN